MCRGIFLLSNIKSVLRFDSNPALEWFALSVQYTVNLWYRFISFLSQSSSSHNLIPGF